MSTYAMRYMTAVLASGEIKNLLKYGSLDHLFELDPVSQPIYDFVKDYVETSGELPSIDLVEQEIDVSFKIEDGSCNYLHQKAFEEWTKRKLKLAQSEANKEFGDDPFKSLAILREAIGQIDDAKNAPMVSNFKDAIDSLWPYEVNKWTAKDALATFGWPYVDDQTGGIMPDDLVSFVGRPGQGKTWFLLWVALHMWRTMKKPIVFVTMEMSKEAIMERLAAIFTGTAMDFFKFGQAPTFLPGSHGGKKVNPKQKLKQQLIDLQNSDMPPFIIVDGNLAATVEDVAGICRQYQPAACFIDGAYILGHPDAHGPYDKVARNVPLIKQRIITAQKIPVLCTWQFQNLSKVLKKGEKPTLDHIGYSDTIAQFSSLIFGLFQDDDPSNVESLYQRVIDMLKGRGGQVGEFNVHWDFIKMNFGQVMPEPSVKIWN